MQNQIAANILEQLGGHRFVAMTGARNLVAGSNSLQFDIGRGATRGINKVRVTLQTSDTYRVEFWKISNYGLNIADRGRAENVYADRLAETFTEHTGFDTRL